MDHVIAELENLLHPECAPVVPVLAGPSQALRTEVLTKDPVIAEAVRAAVEAERATVREFVRDVAKRLAAASDAVHDLDVAYSKLAEKLIEGEDDAQISEEA